MNEPVIYMYGTKEAYSDIQNHAPFTLYFCTDSKELFKGDDLYSDGVRLVATYDNLPAPTTAANNKLYICEDTGEGYVLPTGAEQWKQVIAGVDNTTICKDDNGRLAVKEIPMKSVAGLQDSMTAINNSIKETHSKKITTTLLAVNWTNKQQTVTIADMTAATNGIASLPSAAAEEVIQAVSLARLGIANQTNGAITFSVTGSIPSVDIPIEVILLG